ncbi:glycosyltransferase family 4 protein [Butyricimonas paravirosa]|uniref:glycosyltransferase family 4 protein n=1 Tax=Butyricimonas paravirosa TaxID=1472417 RepID=UPI0022E7D2E1|nr:glycosyltransferase family 4 protein [Butyricimonas paravirosa]
MNILLIDHYAGNPELGMEFRPYYLAKEWVNQGHQVLLIGATYSHLRKRQPQEGMQKVNGINYYWIKTNVYRGNGIGRIISMFVFVFKLMFGLKRIYDSFKPNMVIASSTYPLDIYPARKIAQHYKAKLIYEVHDLWPLSPMELGGYSKWHPFIVLMQRAENFAYKYSDQVVSLLPNALDHMKKHGLADGKFIYIPNGFDRAEWENNEENKYCQHHNFLKELRNSGKKILGYVGGHSKSNALDFLLDAMKLINDEDIVCVLVGDGQEKMRLVQRTKREKISNVVFLDSVFKNEIPSLLADMDVLYIGWENNPLYRFGISPNKLIDYMLSGKPILHSVNAANDWVAELDCGVSVPAENPKAIVQGVEYLFSLNKDILLAKGGRGNEYAMKHFDYSILAKKFIENC